eukprot:CAMPEP_0197714824 /NCGR_PEP_ID=MMETSP1338-20131121/131155_1 /TAXON_ID=43686 ORGANISM="Pelagodinium beii, Strain RCC1491" /NCGR_SAMPLE_ID=MMETSP1338 /ASSEMBLY_ACC=CAM_ASM_000754 /LENGTH=75 /DNA_ID=CAMNT_0043298767 /DNA_START=243 /DNA_END=470 /DNA_ORIENTATION=+
MPARSFKSMVIVVPALPKGQDSNQPVVHGKIAGPPVLKAPDVTYGVDSPGTMPEPDHPGKESPEHAWQTAKGIKA